MKEHYELMKVVDPYRHMTKAIRDHLFNGMRARDDCLNNDTFIRWTVGSEKAEYDASEEKEELEDKDSYEQSIFYLAKVDEFLLKHFDKDEEIIILFWW